MGPPKQMFDVFVLLFAFDVFAAVCFFGTLLRSTNRSRETQGQRNQRRRDRKRALEACFNVLGICMGSRCYLMSIYTTSIPLIVLSLTVAIGNGKSSCW